MKLEHVAFNVIDSRAMAEWYSQHLQMEIVRADENAPFIRFLADKSRESMIELYSNPAAAVPDYAAFNPLSLHLAFHVTDQVEATAARLVKAGAQQLQEPSLSPLGDKMVFLRDPWGTPLQLIERRKPLL
jgi:glyoxylase I family protein